MKKFTVTAAALLSGILSAQYMVVGKDSLTLENFKRDNEYGLKNAGIQSTLRTTQDFLLLQQFAAEKRADTTASFRQAVAAKTDELRARYFYPKSVVDPLLKEFVQANNTELKIQLFTVPKSAADIADYRKVYAEVTGGKLKLEDAVKTYMKNSSQPMYIKPGAFDTEMYAELKALKPGSYTKLYENPNYIAFAKLLGSRPSLGYLVFGAISFADDENAAKTKTAIYTALQGGKKFQDVAGEFGSTEEEKRNGGLIMGSPTLPDEVYRALEGKKAGDYSQPVLIDKKYYVFNIYSIQPYQLSEQNSEFFQKEMMNSVYAKTASERLASQLKKEGYKEFQDFKLASGSYSGLFSIKNDKTPLASYRSDVLTAGEMKKIISEKLPEASALTAEQWKKLAAEFTSQFVLRNYSKNFPEQKDIKSELDALRKNLYSEYIFSDYLNERINNHPELLKAYFDQNKAKFVWGGRAKVRVAIIRDGQIISSVKKEIRDTKDWESMKNKYSAAGKNAKATFEEGKLEADAEVFTKYNVPFSKGIYETKMGGRDLVIAIDEILPPMQMTQSEAEELLKDAVREQELQRLIAEQRAKTKIEVQPAFLKDLEANFKK